MSESEGEHVARSVALEQAYVHEVYEQCAEKTVQSRHWPRIYQFLEELEPGALVCDIGCGNGKYLSVNHSIFKVGVDRCKRFTDIAREKENEVLICDNLALPFRDGSFDAVLSIAVVHHFATTERRVHALKELARVLRIGGRLVISVWAMEQRHRKFQSQDVLVPWPKAYCANSKNKSKYSGTLNVSDVHATHNAQKDSQRKCKSKGYWIDPIFSPSPSTSSLSSPNETCYSFFRRALQKLAGGRRGSGNRPWFLESWQNGGGKNRKDYEQEEPPDVDELPIELRRVEDVNVSLTKQPDSLSIKSKSLGDILEIQRLEDLVRSRSSIPGLCSMLTSDLNLDGESRTSSSMSGSKPRLVKQKSHLEDAGLENPVNTAIRELNKDIPDSQVTPSHSKRGSILKQSSMNEELMSTERMEEKERVKRNIMKQASLNEDLIYKGNTFEALRESLYSGNASKRFQRLTDKIKQSTNIEVSGISIKNGFVKILQGWKSSESETSPAADTQDDSKTKANDKAQPAATVKKEVEGIERRLSREDGSDSSKDSSLQSDTSVDSEDSFASVIFVPKQDVAPVPDVLPATTGHHHLGSTSAPPSPRVKYPPDLSSSRLKLISMSPLLKQFPATSKSLPPPSPPGLSPRTLNPVFTRPFFGPTPTQQPSASEKILGPKKSDIPNNDQQPTNPAPQDETKKNEKIEVLRNTVLDSKKPSLQTIRAFRSMSETVDLEEPKTIDDTAPLLPNAVESKETPCKEKENGTTGKEEESRKVMLNQIKELLKQKSGFATRTKPSFPLVRRASSTASGRLEAVTKVLPRLLSLELFNPETDDLDSDSSGVSSPESVGSVISVISDERYAKKDNNKSECTESEVLDSSAENVSDPSDTTNEESSGYVADSKEDETRTATDSSSQCSRLLKAAANVASSLEDTVEAAIQKTHTRVSTEAQRGDTETSVNTENKKNRTEAVLDDQLPAVEDTWSEECRQHLIDFTERLNGNLMRSDKSRQGSEEKVDTNGSSQILDKKGDNKCEQPSMLSSEISKATKSSKYNDLSDTIAWLSNSNNGFPENTENVNGNNSGVEMHRSTSDDIMDFVMVSNTGEFIGEKENSEKNSAKPYVRSANSIESSDIGESIDNTISLSDGSHADSTGRLCSSMVSLLSNNAEYPKSYAEKRRLQIQRRSASEETPPRYPDNSKRSTDCLVTSTGSNATLSASSSQESLPSDRGGGAITYHQYYHVFREGELDQLINKYVENLHIISSYYDHASWCIVAEKVQVWTI
ncbi:class I SAM-dependent methyltransferase fire dancer isoform X1 [Halictus rubicundus]|uniref:class I SAM-dependent methyltransferase fire dancer isoform X1 n=1 Tax=Halictus rubicundus TaxID=77578 RepID=UPI0040352868